MPANGRLPYWLSLERYSVGRSNRRGNLFEISVVTVRPPDEPKWSRVRLIIVDESSDNENPETCIIDHRPSSRRSDAKLERYLIPYTRKREETASNDARYGDGCVNLLLGLRRVNEFSTLSELQPLASMLSSNQNLPPILYDKVHHLDSLGCLTPITLNCSRAVVAEPDRFTTPRQVRREGHYPGTSRHLIRILPFTGAGSIQISQANRLPSTVTCCIATILVRSHPEGYRQQLFQLGTISHSWAPVLGLFFSLHTTTDHAHDPFNLPRNKASIISVARSLELRPERAHLMRAFSLTFYREFPRSQRNPEEQTYESLKAANTILSLLANSPVAHIDLHRVPPSLYNDYVAALSNLSTVVDCSDRLIWDVQNSFTDPFIEGSLFIDDLQAVLANWPLLETLQLNFGRTPASATIPRKANGPQLTPILPIGNNMHALSIGFLGGRDRSGWKMPSANFTRFFRAKPPLRDLDLWRMSDLLNADFLFALVQISHTLESLIIDHCDFRRANPTEEWAIDMVVSQLHQLYTLTIISSDCMTEKGVAKKTKHPERGVFPALILDDIEPFDPRKLLDALEETHWSRISINHRDGDISSEIHEQARHVAIRRDISLT